MDQVARYWGRKPLEQVLKYISKYSKTNEIVLDPFAGSGGIIRGALQLFRKAIYNDLNPVAKIIARANLIRKKVSIDIQKRHLDLYMIDYQGEKREVRYYIWEGNRITKARLYGGQLIDCKCKDYDGEIPYFYPKIKFFYENGRKFEIRTPIGGIEQLYTRRNLLILADIFDQIPKNDDKILTAFFVTVQESGKNQIEGHGSTGIPSLWVPSKSFIENNPYHHFESSIERVNEAGMNVKEGSLSDVLSGNADVTFLVNDAKKLPLDDESVDLIVTDPPFFDEVQYFELTYLYASWLGIKLDFDNEIVVNYARRKNEPRYLTDLEKAIVEMHRVLKKNKYAIIMFHEEDDIKVNQIKNIISKYFTIEKEENEITKQRNVGDRDTKRGRDLKIFIAKKIN